MIVTVTLNPALDRTITIPHFTPGTVNRSTSTRIDAGGKGINVSKALKEMGTDSFATGFIAGANGRFIKEHLSALCINTNFVEVEGETRVNIKIVSEDGSHTDINEPGFNVTDSDFDRLIERVRQFCRHGNVIVISGSAPGNLSLESYVKLCTTVTSFEGVRLVLDADGAHLRSALAAKPDFIKPNTAELSNALGYEVSTREEIRAGALQMIEWGAKNVAVSMGSEGALFVNAHQAIHVRTPKVEVRGPVGAGDVMVAGIAQSLENGNDFESLARYAVAAGAASVTIEGTRMASRRMVLSLFGETIVEKL